MTSSSAPLVGALRRNALTATDVIAMATATYAPTAALYFNTPIAASFAGSSVPFAFLVATVAMLIVATCMAQLARHQASAGGYYSWIRNALGQRAGFLVGWLVLAGSSLVVPGVYAAEGDYVSTILARYGVHVSWIVIALVLVVLITWVNVIGVRPSVRTGMAILAVELVIVTVLCVVVVAKGGTAGNTIVPSSRHRGSVLWAGRWSSACCRLSASRRSRRQARKPPRHAAISRWHCSWP